MLKRKASPEAYGVLCERFVDLQSTVAGEFLSGQYPDGQPWKLVPAAKLVRIWNDFSSTGIVRDEKGLDDILDLIIENTARLEINNIVSGHSQLPMETILEDYFDGDDDDRVPELQESFTDWAVDLPDGGWRISDYAVPKLLDALALAVEAKTAEEKLPYLDIALNVVHCRSDLASWFVEGGSSTLVGISGEGLTA